jgi:hypothetical protein
MSKTYTGLFGGIIDDPKSRWTRDALQAAMDDIKAPIPDRTSGVMSDIPVITESAIRETEIRNIRDQISELETQLNQSEVQTNASEIRNREILNEIRQLEEELNGIVQPIEARSRNQQGAEPSADNVGPESAATTTRPATSAEPTPRTVASPEAPAVPAAATARVSSPRNIEVIATVPTPEQVTTQVMPEQQATATPAPQIAQNNVENNTARGLEEMTYTLASKLDRVIDLLDNGNDTQERLYRATV